MIELYNTHHIIEVILLVLGTVSSCQGLSVLWGLAGLLGVNPTMQNVCSIDECTAACIPPCLRFICVHILLMFKN